MKKRNRRNGLVVAMMARQQRGTKMKDRRTKRKDNPKKSWKGDTE